MARLLLIWLLALVLPAQGVAAATMGFCGAGHQPQMQLLAGAVPGDHAAHAQGHAHHMAASDEEPAPAAHGMSHAKFKCSACAACCMATALPPAVAALPVVEVAIESAVVAMAAYVGPESRGLERPPKHRLA